MNQAEQVSNLPAVIDPSEAGLLEQKVTASVLGEGAQLERLAALQAEMLASRSNAPELSDIDWLVREFGKHAELFRDAQHMREEAQEIVTGIQTSQAKINELQTHLAMGNSRESWVARELERGAASHGVASASEYAGMLDQAVQQANDNMHATITRLDGQVSQARNLDGFIAERHHVETFNLDAQTRGTGYRAEMRSSTEANSVDIVIKDESGKVVRRYQSKYGQDADATQDMFDRGDYRGQRKLAPEGQDVENSTDHIEYDGVKSEPLSKEKAKNQQTKAQEQGSVDPYDWKTLDKMAIGQQLGMQALTTVGVSCGLHAMGIVGRRMLGESDQPLSEDVLEFLRKAGDNIQSTGVHVTAAGSVMIAARSGWLGPAMKASPAGALANVAMIGVESTKILYRFSKGELTSAEALDALGATTAGVLFGVAAASQGAALGASIGTVFGPAGTFVGAALGGMIGGFVGGAVGKTLYEGCKALASSAANAVTSTLDAVVSVVGKMASRIFG